MVRKSVLRNGVRVLTEPMPQMVSATIGIWVENGSRYEHERRQNGVSHFIEHLLFKGTKKRTAAQIAEEFDAVGGVLNAFTGKEYTCYYAKVLGADLKMATELLADLFLESVFDPAEIDRERQVVLQEISQAEDTPDDFIHDLFNLHFWKGHPLALPIFGSVETVNAIDRELLVSFMADRYRAGRVFIAAAGAVDHDLLVADCERYFGGIKGDWPRRTDQPTKRNGDGAEPGQGTRAGAHLYRRSGNQPGRSAALCRVRDEHCGGRRDVVATVSGSYRGLELRGLVRSFVRLHHPGLGVPLCCRQFAGQSGAAIAFFCERLTMLLRARGQLVSRGDLLRELGRFLARFFERSRALRRFHLQLHIEPSVARRASAGSCAKPSARSSIRDCCASGTDTAATCCTRACCACAGALA